MIMKKEEQKKEQFTTTDLGLVAALRCHGITLDDFDSTNLGRIIFSYDYPKSEEVAKMAKKFWSDDFLVDALAYWNAIKTIKNQIHSRF